MKVFILALFVAATLLAQSCKTTRQSGCGCGADLNKVNLPRRR